MSPDNVGSAVELLDRRRDVLSALGGDAQHVRDLCDELDVSRSTVNRSLRELEGAGWVTRADGGYRRTTTGSLALQEYQDQVAALGAVQTHADALSPLPSDTPLDPAILADATVETIADTDTFELVATLRSAFADAAAVRGVWPSITDDRTVRPLASLADGDGRLELAVDEGVHSAMRSVAPTTFGGTPPARCRVETSEDVPARLGVFVVDGEDRRVLVTIYGDGGSIHAVAEVPADDTTTNWAASVFADASVPRLDGDDVVQPIATARPGAPEWPDDTEVALRAQGFVPVDDSALTRREGWSPGAMLRTTPTLAAVAAGRTLDREHVVDGQRREFALDLVDALATGQDLALVGPPGSGKSTVCKSVACRWRERSLGPVCYRESDSNAVLDDPLTLSASLAEAEGMPLVVVEDAVRPAANAIFETVEECGEDGVAFLFDARRSEWASPPEPLDPRRESLRRDGVETVSVPSLDDRERERLHHHVEAIVDGPVPPFEEFVADEDVADDSLSTPHVSGSEGAGELLTLAHRYGLMADVSMDDRRDVTPLSRNVRDVYDDVSVERDVFVTATLVNVLNAAGLPVERDLLDALGVADDGPSADAVETAVDTLQGRVLFPDEDGTALVHDAWSHLFLTLVVEERDAASAHRIFAAAANALFHLVTDPAFREDVIRYRQGDAPTVAAFDDNPEHWRDVVVDRVYDLGRESPNLAPLYGHPEYTALELPENCSTWCWRRAIVCRAGMYTQAGEHEVAFAECDRIDDLAESVDDDRQTVVMQARSEEFRCMIAHQRGNFERAQEHGEHALELAREIDDEKIEASVLNGLGLVAWYRGDVDEAERRLRESLSLYERVQAPKSHANALTNLGIVLRERGDLDGAGEFFERSHRKRRRNGARLWAVTSAINIGVVARDSGDLDEAISWYRGALEEANVLGLTGKQSHANRALGNALRWRGDFEESAARLEQALHIAREEELQRDECLCLRGLGATKRELGELNAAESFLEESVSLAEEIGDERHVVLARAHRGLVTLARGDAEAAAVTLTDAVETLESLDRAPGLARARRWKARALDAAGEHERARSAYEAAVDQYESLGATPYLRETLDELTEVCERAGADETAATYRDRRDALGANN